MGDERERIVTVLGNFSGRNAGDAAILGGLLRDVTEAFPDTSIRFLVPTIKPGFIRRAFPEYPVEPVSLLPWKLSVKILGVPVVRSVLKADLVLVTDNILFDRKLYNPLFNYLFTLSFVLPWGARRGVPIVLYNMSLGPVTTGAGRKCLGRVLRSAEKIILRDERSTALVDELHPDGPEPMIRADSALSVVPAPEEAVGAAADEVGVFRSGRPTLGFNVNSYIDVYVAGKGERIDRDRFQAIVARVLDRAVDELDVDVLMVSTQPMDRKVERGVRGKIRARDRVFEVENPEYGYPELAGFLRRVDAFVGMRTHSLILAASVHTPLGAIVSYPKTTGFLATIGMEEMRLEFSDFSEESLWSLVREVWEKRDSLRAGLRESVAREREKARSAADELSPWLGRSGARPGGRAASGGDSSEIEETSAPGAR